MTQQVADGQFVIHDDTGGPVLGARYSIQHETSSPLYGQTNTAGHTQRLATASRSESVHIYVVHAASVSPVGG